MRLRNKNWTKEYVKEHSKYMISVQGKTSPLTLFKNENPFFLEIGCGKGQFIINQSIRNKTKNFIAMEKETTVIGVALKKAINTQDFEFKNLLFLNWYAENLLDIFEPNSLNGIYLNFSDPWPKKKSIKKRLTYISFLQMYWDLLLPGGVVEIKTDNNDFYEFSLEQIKSSKFKIMYETNDLYNNKEFLKENVATEYENKFHDMGKNISKIVIKKEI